LNVRFLDLARQTAVLRADLEAAIARVLVSGRFVLGEEVESFETRFASYCGTSHAIGVASGTDAITIALQAVGVGHGDEVITAANTCIPTIVGIEAAGAVPVLVDVEEDTFTLDPARLTEAISPRTKAIVPVHLYGQCADLDAIVEIAATAQLKIVEDCAQAHGATYRGQRAGAIGDAAAFSFYPTKNLGALGDGGAVATSDPGVAERALLLRNYGEQERFHHVLRGCNSRLDELQAAVLAAKLPRLEGWNERRRELARRYDEALADVVSVPAEAPDRRHVYHLYVVLVRERDAFRSRLAECGVGTVVHYPIPVHLQPAYASLARPGSLPVAEELAATIVSLPLYPELTDEEVDVVIEMVRSIMPG
jgi:dTDP-4-amino-4,6-dideoxygalactose transaminase